MTDEREAWENELLADVFAKAGATGGSIGGAAGGGGAGLLGGGRGGARGGRWGANRLKSVVCERELTLPMGADAALVRVSEVLAQEGKPLETPYAIPGVPTVAVLTGSIWQNPTVVTVEIPSSDGSSSQVKLRVVAKRSLIIRHTAEKTAEKVREALAQK